MLSFAHAAGSRIAAAVALAYGSVLPTVDVASRDSSLPNRFVPEAVQRPGLRAVHILADGHLVAAVVSVSTLRSRSDTSGAVQRLVDVADEVQQPGEVVGLHRIGGRGAQRVQEQRDPLLSVGRWNGRERK